MPNEITLSLGATAEANTCGSCKFFKRKNDNGPYDSAYGKCEIVLPKKFVEQFQYRDLDDRFRKNDREYTGNEDQIKDNDRCNLYQSDGKSYIVQRRVRP